MKFCVCASTPIQLTGHDRPLFHVNGIWLLQSLLLLSFSFWSAFHLKTNPDIA